MSLATTSGLHCRGWDALHRDAPELWTLACAHLFGEVAYLATVRVDGSPRLHPVTLKYERGDAVVDVDPTSPKLADLQRDPRCTVHSAVSDSTGADPEIIVRCEVDVAPGDESRSARVRVSLEPYNALAILPRDSDRALLRWSAAPAATTDDQRSVDEARAKWVAVTAAANLEAYSSLLEPDAVWAPPGLPPVFGARQILRSFRPAFEAARFALELTPSAVVTLHDVAFERGTFLARRTPVGGGDTFIHNGRYAMTWRHRGGAWRIHRYVDQSDTSSWPDWPTTVPQSAIAITRIAPAETHALRREVLRGGEPDADVNVAEDHSDGAFHLGARDITTGHLIAVVSFSPRGTTVRPGKRAFQLRWMAVDRDKRTVGVGRALIERAIRELGEAGAEVVWAFGRDTALGFYERCGFEIVGDGFVNDEGLPHHVVVRSIAGA